MMKKQMDKFNAEIGMMKESMEDTREGMAGLEDKMDMILGLIIKNGPSQAPPGDGEGSAGSPMRPKSYSSPALEGERRASSEAPGIPASPTSLLGAGTSPKAGRKVQLAPLTLGA